MMLAVADACALHKGCRTSRCCAAGNTAPAAQHTCLSCSTHFGRGELHAAWGDPTAKAASPAAAPLLLPLAE